jgi:cytochrome P450
MARTATTDVEIRGRLIRQGEVVVMLYGSPNRDEDIFGCDSEEFKVTRHPNPHIAFGCGEHSCLGAQLARLEACVLFRRAAAPLSHAGAGRRGGPDAGHHDARREADAGTARD